MSDELIQKVEEIRHWLESNKSLDSCKANNDFMRLAIETSNHVRLLMVLASGMISTEDFKGYDRENAVIVGHFVRLYKIYDTLSYHVSKNHGEIAEILTRLFFETHTRMLYLIKKGSPSIQNFIFVSYKSDKEILNDMLDKQSKRPLIPIEERILNGIRRRLKEDGIEESRLLSNKDWKLDGKDFREIMKEVDLDKQYAYGFGSQSGPVHGNWRDIRAHHLKLEDSVFTPEWEYDSVDPRNIVPMSILASEAVVSFLTWNKTDPDNYVIGISNDVRGFSVRLDQHHEAMLTAKD